MRLNGQKPSFAWPTSGNTNSRTSTTNVRRGTFAIGQLYGGLRDVGNAVNFDPQSVPGQARGLDGSTGRTVIAEHPLIDPVHALELLHVEQEHAAAQHVLKIRAAGAQDGLDVFQALLGLYFDVGAREHPRCRIGGALARDEDQTLEIHSGRVRAYWFWQV